MLLCQAAAASPEGKATRAASSVAHPTEDLVADPSAESPDRLGLGTAQCPSVFEVRLAGPSRWSCVIAIRRRATLSWRFGRAPRACGDPI
jgi:hypothetical protein